MFDELARLPGPPHLETVEETLGRSGDLVDGLVEYRLVVVGRL